MDRKRNVSFLGRRPISKGGEKERNSTVKQRKEEGEENHRRRRTAMKQKVVELLDKSRRLKRDITKVLTESKEEIVEQNETDKLRLRLKEDAFDSLPSFTRETVRTDGNSLNECDLVDFVLGESFASTELQTVDVSSFRSSCFSSDCDEDEVSDDDPLRNNSIIENLFYGGRDVIHLSKEEEKKRSSFALTPKKVQGKRVNIVSKISEKSFPNEKRIPLRKTSNISSRKRSNVDDVKKVKEVFGQKTIEKLSREKKVVVPTKDFVVQPVEPLSVFCLLEVNQGSGFTASNFESTDSQRAMMGFNLYLKCRMFWNSDTAKSDVCWNSNNPSFHFQQLTPILVNDSLLERVQNNIMVIEVWEKRILTKTDQLLGICKVPLHLFYLSFRDREVAKSLLRSKNAVIAANDLLPVVDLFCGRNVGRLGVLLALGTTEQVEALRKSSVVDETCRHVVRSIEESVTGRNGVVTHTFTVTVDSLALDVPPGSTIWAESDCYVQYLFPNQIPVDDLSRKYLSDLIGSVYLSVHRLNRVLCEPVMHWKSKTKHVIAQSSSISIRRTLLGVCPRNGLPFQVWCKYYYPVEKEELVAEVFVPVAILCSLINDGRGLTKLSLPLVTNDPHLNLDIQNPLCTEFSKLGTLNVEIGYQENDIHHEDRNIRVIEARTPPKTERKCSLPVAELVLPPAPCEKVDVIPFEPKREIHTFSASITIERAVHLRLPNDYERHDRRPNVYVSFSTCFDTHFTDVIVNSDEPQWNWQKKVDLPVALISPQLNNSLELRVCHSDDGATRKDGDIVLGRTSVDLSSLFLGFSQLCGWYNIVDTGGCCCGEIKVIIQPMCNLPVFRCRLRHISNRDGDHFASKDCYLTTGSYAEFPSHIGQFMEQRIRFNNDQTLGDDCNLDDKSRSFLMTNLKERLVEIDNLFGHAPLVGEAKPLTELESVSSDERESFGTELVIPKIINVNSIKEVVSDSKDECGPSNGNAKNLSVDQNGNDKVSECLPTRKTRRCRIVAAIFNTREQNEID